MAGGPLLITTHPPIHSPSRPPQQFQDRAFWDNFFRERGAEAFEWYGSFRELRPYVAKAIPERTGKASELLVIGCGNSDFSTQLYLAGGYHRVVNVDFSAPVIAEMRAKTGALCPGMQWLVQDVTALEMEAQAVDAVLDKGTLDAIFSTPESEPQVRGCVDAWVGTFGSRRIINLGWVGRFTIPTRPAPPISSPQADKMLDEVGRVLSRAHGRYLVVTLGQDFILRKLLQRFGAGPTSGWRLDLYAVEPPAEQQGGAAAAASAASPFLTLVGIASRVGANEGEGEAEGAAAGVTLHFDASARRLVKAPLRFGPGDHAEVMALVALAQERHALKQELRAVEPGRFKGDVDIWLRQPAQQGGEEEDAAEAESKGPRYTLSIVDIVPPTPTPLPCAVLLIPQGREHEWLFATADGLRQVAQSADYRRLVCVRMNRGHRFRDMEEVKAELGPVVLDFVPADCDPGYLVPYLAVGDSIGRFVRAGGFGGCERCVICGLPPQPQPARLQPPPTATPHTPHIDTPQHASRNVVASGSLPECGEYCVEEEDDEEDGGAGAVLRRLVFLRNQHVIQSEIRLAPPKQPKQGKGKGKGKKKGKGGGGKGGKGKGASSTGADHEGEAEAGQQQQLVVDWSYLCFDYHRAILAGLIGLLYPRLRAALRDPALPRPRCLVIGLGGGGLPLFLRRYVPCLDVTVVELEGGLAGVAEAWFGFRPDAQLRVEVGDGVARVVGEEGTGGAADKAEAWDAIVVDVDNKDASLGISCPAPAFLTPAFLQACRARLSQGDVGGVLAMNVAARSAEMLGGALDALAGAFVGEGAGGELYEVRPTEQDVNRVIFALRSPRPVAGGAAKASLGLLTERWLEEVAGAAAGATPIGASAAGEDPLELGEISRRIERRGDAKK